MNPKFSTVDTIDLDLEGFKGELFPVSTNQESKAVLIAVGGLKDKKVLRPMARYFNEKNIAVLIVYFYGGGMLQLNQNLIPIEYVEAAVSHLRDAGYHRIGITGLSKGAEYALLSASKIADIEVVLAFSPSHCVWEGEISSDGLFKTRASGEAGFSWRNKPLPFLNYSFSATKMLKVSLLQREMTCEKVFREAINKSNNYADIAVENIGGDVFLFSAERDTIFPSSDASQRIVERLENNKFDHDYKSYVYKYASHVLLPIYIKGQKLLFKVERQYPDECKKMREKLNADIEGVLNGWNAKN
ncbi:acyl-CoA thioester hydrolase/BAAT C-terminal domain-containing protein [Pseudogracilibacillus sp. SO30301A]|uniref:acyl-CoA thioester hydrolase/BAAT C-terminal domain-containing protein n=1 Tax=Pseudogracilibacillus sp. SO30301A TaxID=3098291 RepID=UPI00300E58CA